MVFSSSVATSTSFSSTSSCSKYNWYIFNDPSLFFLLLCLFLFFILLFFLFLFLFLFLILSSFNCLLLHDYFHRGIAVVFGFVSGTCLSQLFDGLHNWPYFSDDIFLVFWWTSWATPGVSSFFEAYCCVLYAFIVWNMMQRKVKKIS